MNNLAAWIRTSQGLGRDGLIEWMAKKKYDNLPKCYYYALK